MKLVHKSEIVVLKMKDKPLFVVIKDNGVSVVGSPQDGKVCLYCFESAMQTIERNPGMENNFEVVNAVDILGRDNMIGLPIIVYP